MCCFVLCVVVMWIDVVMLLFAEGVRWHGRGVGEGTLRAGPSASVTNKQANKQTPTQQQQLTHNHQQPTHNIQRTTTNPN